MIISLTITRDAIKSAAYLAVGAISVCKLIKIFGKKERGIPDPRKVG